MAENKRHNKGAETRRQQAAATPKVSPRWLARSVAKGYCGGINEKWRDHVAKLPKFGRARIYPKVYSKDCEG